MDDKSGFHTLTLVPSLSFSQLSRMKFRRCSDNDTGFVTCTNAITTKNTDCNWGHTVKSFALDWSLSYIFSFRPNFLHWLRAYHSHFVVAIVLENLLNVNTINIKQKNAHCWQSTSHVCFHVLRGTHSEWCNWSCSSSMLVKFKRIADWLKKKVLSHSNICLATKQLFTHIHIYQVSCAAIEN